MCRQLKPNACVKELLSILEKHLRIFDDLCLIYAAVLCGADDLRGCLSMAEMACCSKSSGAVHFSAVIFALLWWDLWALFIIRMTELCGPTIADAAHGFYVLFESEAL